MARASHEKHKEKAAGQAYTVAVITVSTSRFQKYGKCVDPERCEDESGKIITGLLQKAGHQTAYWLLKDDALDIETTLVEMLETADAAIVCGGTGLTPGDVTIEAVAPMFEKTIPGFGELFRALSYDEVGTASVLTRAAAGAVRGRAIFCIPGSPNAAKLAVSKIIVPELGHILSHIRSK